MRVPACGPRRVLVWLPCVAPGWQRVGARHPSPVVRSRHPCRWGTIYKTDPPRRFGDNPRPPGGGGQAHDGQHRAAAAPIRPHRPTKRRRHMKKLEQYRLRRRGRCGWRRPPRRCWWRRWRKGWRPCHELPPFRPSPATWAVASKLTSTPSRPRAAAHGRVATAADAAVVSGNGDGRHTRRRGEAVGYCPATGTVVSGGRRAVHLKSAPWPLRRADYTRATTVLAIRLADTARA